MPGDLDEFIQLHRTFHDLALSEEEGKESALFRLMSRDKATQWSDLLEEPRVVLLSEAGSGKTEELRHICRDLRQCAKRAFFLRIEHVARDFDTAFEEGTPEEFEEWIISDEDGRLLLDSVDEARLKDPKDFERAIRTIGRKIRRVLQHTHVVITGRTDAWRPKTDLLICEQALPWTTQATVPEEEQESDDAVTTEEVPGPKRRKSPFRIVALDDLAGEQVDRFVSAKGVTDIKAFKKAVERADAWSFSCPSCARNGSIRETSATSWRSSIDHRLTTKRSPQSLCERRTPPATSLFLLSGSQPGLESIPPQRFPP